MPASHCQSHRHRQRSVDVVVQMEPLYDDLRGAAVEYAKAINAYAATIAAQVKFCLLCRSIPVCQCCYAVRLLPWCNVPTCGSPEGRARATCRPLLHDTAVLRMC